MPMREMKPEPLATSQTVSSMKGRKEYLFRSGEDLFIDTGRPYKSYTSKLASARASRLGLIVGLKTSVRE